MRRDVADPDDKGQQSLAVDEIPRGPGVANPTAHAGRGTRVVGPAVRQSTSPGGQRPVPRADLFQFAILREQPRTTPACTGIFLSCGHGYPLKEIFVVGRISEKSADCAADGLRRVQRSNSAAVEQWTPLRLIPVMDLLTRRGA